MNQRGIRNLLRMFAADNRNRLRRFQGFNKIMLFRVFQGVSRVFLRGFKELKGRFKGITGLSEAF